jgi:hypothetical protein
MALFSNGSTLPINNEAGSLKKFLYKKSLSGLPDFSTYIIPKRGQIYQLTTKCTKFTTKYNQMTTEYTKMTTKYTQMPTEYTKMTQTYTKMNTKYTN